MNKYIKPEIEISHFSIENIVTVSGEPRGITAAEQGNEALFNEFGTDMVKTIKISDIIMVY